jgi:hypothetical protein
MGKVKKKEDIKVEASIWFEIIRNNSERKHTKMCAKTKQSKNIQKRKYKTITSAKKKWENQLKTS